MAKLASFFTALMLIFTSLFGIDVYTAGNDYTVVSQKRLDSVVSAYATQGLCCDGEYFYGSGALSAVNFTGLAKFDLNMKCVGLKSLAVPREFTKQYGSNHIGGIDCAGGFIYAPVEGKIKDRGYVYNFILLFSCDDLEYTGTYYDLSSEHLTDGIPWCAVDADGGFLYTSKYNGCNEILQYDLGTMELIKTIPLQTELNRLQGGSVYDGKLWLSYDCANSTEEEILCVNLENGEVAAAFTRHCTGYDNEAEDVCVYPLPDGSLFHTVDYDKLLNARVTHYKKTEKSANI